MIFSLGRFIMKFFYRITGEEDRLTEETKREIEDLFKSEASKVKEFGKDLENHRALVRFYKSVYSRANEVSDLFTQQELKEMRLDLEREEELFQHKEKSFSQLEDFAKKSIAERRKDGIKGIKNYEEL